jgi:hypothetical protein
MSTFLKPTVIVNTALGVLRRELVLPNLVWRDAAGDFAGALNDTISIRLPAYAKARTRVLRSGSARTRDNIAEQKVDVTLNTDVYKDIKISDEELTLDIKNFGLQVLNPVLAGVAETIEDQLIATIQGATYAKSIAFTYATGDVWKDIILPARELLNKARVPQAGRVLAVGSGIETAMLGTALFVQAQQSGNTNALEEAVIGRKAGFTIVSVPGLGPNEAYAFHQTAYVMSNRAPVVPAGAPFGASQSYDGMAMRVVRVLDSSTIQDILAVDSWTGSNVTADPGYFDLNGKFVPTDADLGAALAVTGVAATDIFTSAAHGYAAGDRVIFTALTGGAGLSTNRDYYVIAANLAANTFQVSATPGGASVDFTTDVTAGTVQKNGNKLVVRAVKVTAS